jgi:flagellar biosynthesis/type III secretory pathway protein FliH
MNLDRAALEQSQNPASLVLLAFLRARETTRNMDFRFEARKQLAFPARERGYNEELLAKLDEPLEGIMKLPEFLAKQYEEALEEYKREKRVPFITAAERIELRREIAEGFQQGYTIGRQEGHEAERQEGLQQGLLGGIRLSLTRRLQKRFGDAAREIIDALNAVDDGELLNRVDELDAENAPLEAIREQITDYLNR